MSEVVDANIDLAGKRVGIKIVSDETYSLSQLAVELGVPEYEIKARVTSGKLNGNKVGRFWYVFGQDLIDFFRNGPGLSYTSRPNSRKRPLSDDIKKAANREADRKGRTKKQ